MCPPQGPVIVAKEMRYYDRPCLNGESVLMPRRTECYYWQQLQSCMEGGCATSRRAGQTKPWAIPGTTKEALKNELHLHVFLYKIFPGAPQTTDEHLYKYKFTRLHNLHVKWGQFSQEVHKPVLKKF